MTATAYCMRDMHGTSTTRPGSVCVPRPQGCGTPHEAAKNDEGRWVIECDSCAPYLIGNVYGYSSDAAGVPLSPDEIRSGDLAKRDAEAAQATVMSSMTEAFVQMLNKTGANFTTEPAPAQKSLVEQLAELSPAEKAQVAALLTGTDEKPALPKRGPGRPRTTPAS